MICGTALLTENGGRYLGSPGSTMTTNNQHRLVKSVDITYGVVTSADNPHPHTGCSRDWAVWFGYFATFAWPHGDVDASSW